MDTYRWVLLLKFVSVLGYAGGLVGAFVTSEAQERKRAVHSIASPALLLTWLSGFWLASLLGVPMTELWIVGGLVCSLLSQGALIAGAGRGRRSAASFAATAVPLVAVLAFMIFRPTGEMLR